uniref:Uncharacterized protein n=2 Tax=Aegilops tauschii subsp. strangulata TaxID=200361 RepID=A0A453E4S7_AEGTS
MAFTAGQNQAMEGLVVVVPMAVPFTFMQGLKFDVGWAHKFDVCSYRFLSKPAETKFSSANHVCWKKANFLPSESSVATIFYFRPNCPSSVYLSEVAGSCKAWPTATTLGAAVLCILRLGKLC